MLAGFHGDLYILKLVHWIIGQGVRGFIETGCNEGTTLAYVARTWPNLPCYSCEPNPDSHELAREKTAASANAKVLPMLSQDFMLHIDERHPELHDQSLLWLDSHGPGFVWPLQEEVAWFTRRFQRSWALIDDFKVPGRPEFGFDTYGGQECSFDFIRPHIDEIHSSRLFVPSYSERTSLHHPLRGWALLTKGCQDPLPRTLATFMIELPLAESARWKCACNDSYSPR
jgi:hypothetical protein